MMYKLTHRTVSFFSPFFTDNFGTCTETENADNDADNDTGNTSNYQSTLEKFIV